MATTRKYIYDVSTKGTQKATQSVNKLTGNFNKLAKQVGTAALAYFGARGLLNGFKQAVALAGEQEQAERQLSTALGHTSQALLDQASALQQVSVFGDETIIRAQALIAAFVDDEEQIKKATAATLDLAAAKGMDLAAAADLVSKTLGSSTNAMSRYGIAVEGAVGSTERLDSLVDNIADKFGGQAAAAADTMTGSIDQMNNAVGDAAETLGETMAPAIIDVTGAIKAAAEAYQNFISGPITNAGPPLSAAADSLIALEKRYTEARIAFEGTTDAFESAVIIERLQNIQSAMTGIKFDDVAAAIPFREAGEAVTDLSGELKKVEVVSDAITNADKEAAKANKILMNEKVKNAALGAKDARSGVVNTIKRETAEAVAGYISSILQSVPFPLNVILAAAGGGAVNSLMEKALPSFATGGDFVTNGPQLALLGDNPGGRERVQVTPLSSPNINGPQGGMNINFYGPVTNEAYVRDELIPQIRQGLALA